MGRTEQEGATGGGGATRGRGVVERGEGCRQRCILGGGVCPRLRRPCLSGVSLVVAVVGGAVKMGSCLRLEMVCILSHGTPYHGRKKTPGLRVRLDPVYRKCSHRGAVVFFLDNDGEDCRCRTYEKYVRGRPRARSSQDLNYNYNVQVLDDLDRHTWVLEPEKPSRSTTYRRIAVARHCSVMLKIDPRSPADVRQRQRCKLTNSVSTLPRLRYHLVCFFLRGKARKPRHSRFLAPASCVRVGIPEPAAAELAVEP